MWVGAACEVDQARKSGWQRKVAWVRQKTWQSRSDRSELLFGNAVVQCGLDGGPGVPDGCWWVVRVVVKMFDELSGVVSRPSCGFKDEWDQVDAGYLSNFFFSSRLAMYPGRALAAVMRLTLEEKGETMAVSM